MLRNAHSAMPRSAACILACLALALGARSDANATTIYADQDFQDADWATVVVADLSGTFSFVAAQDTGTGNPAPSRFIQHETEAGPQSVALGHLLTAAVYDPATEGAIATVQLELDAMVTDGGPAGAVGYGLLAMQGSTLATGSGPAVLEGTGWNSLVLGPFTAADLPGIDLNSTGAPITFGFFSSNGSAGLPVFSQSFVDSFQATVTPVPEPGTFVLLAVGLLGIGVRQRRT